MAGRVSLMSPGYIDGAVYASSQKLFAAADAKQSRPSFSTWKRMKRKFLKYLTR